MNFIKTVASGGVCSPKGFLAAGIKARIKKSQDKKDLALIFSTEENTIGAAVFTKNKATAAPILVSKRHIKNPTTRAIIANSGYANARAKNGELVSMETCQLIAKELGIKKQEVLVASTGVTGQALPIQPIKNAIPKLKEALSEAGSDCAAKAILTTDTVKKECAVSLEINNKTVTIGGIAKGSGMINPNMATMLSFLTTDAKIEKSLLQTLLQRAADISFNRVSVDGDTSTNDTLAILANGKSGVEVKKGSIEEEAFFSALSFVCIALAKKMAADGEGATKLVECVVKRAQGFNQAAIVADSVINSPLVKTALFGADANWGRILSAVGNAQTKLDIEKVDITLRAKENNNTQISQLVCKGGYGVLFDEAIAKQILLKNEIIIEISLNSGEETATAWGCDLSYDYVKINGDYRT